MKYARLSKEQFEELHQEFINFLATQSITADEWKDIKANTPEVAEQELDVFSDLVWEGVLGQVKYIEHFSPQQIHLFKIEETKMRLIALKLNNREEINLATREGFKWLQENLMSDELELFNAEKAYTDDKNKDKFALIQQGGNITKGELFEYFDKMIQN
ncbi:DUF6495 family protein [Winogradskyella maritima]|uniref:DUF6495 family protein n=1 Tax=Winogradskyella maritima TaxID=1517766 RepID=A0ABV8AGE1_9FLAO|nr:DUF6495 family protein [Winogradskyella maritima]